MVPERELMFVLPHLGELSLAGWPFHTGNTGIYWTFILFILENILENGIFPSIYWKNSGILLFSFFNMFHSLVTFTYSDLM